MPLVTAFTRHRYGTIPAVLNPATYCVNNTSASDYGKCYNIACCKAIFVQTDTTTWPIDPTTGDSFPCAKDGTCTRYTSTVSNRIHETIFSFSGKQAIIQHFRSRVHGSVPIRDNITVAYLVPMPLPSNITADFGFFLPAVHYEVSSWPIYDPVSNFKAYFNPYTITSGYVTIIRWSGTFFTTSANVTVYEEYKNNIWYAFDMVVTWAYESSPLAIIPLDYSRDYVPYQELRNAFGYATTGVDQPGWNADDIIRVLRELFPDRAWAVFDDRQYVLYLYNLTPDYVPDWLIEKLAPTAMKVIQPPADATVAKAWLDLLNERNAQIPTQAELP